VTRLVHHVVALATGNEAGGAETECQQLGRTEAAAAVTGNHYRTSIPRV